MAECYAVRKGAKMLEVCGFPNWVIELDAINIVRAVQFPSQLAPKASIITDIKDAISQAHSGNVCYVFRSRNTVAHCLASVALSGFIVCDWLDYVPLSIGSFVKVDILALNY